MPDQDEFDPERWAVGADTAGPSAYRKRGPRPRQLERFLKGPIPWRWLQAAMVLPGKALAVGLLLWLQCGLTGRQTVPLCLAHAEANGISEWAARRALRELEAAGLVAGTRKPGRGLEVTLLLAGD